MKTITIGRGENSNIYIENPMISRRHAILKIPTFGKMEIVDMSTNGTFVNTVRIRPNVPYPVTRKDVINFANVRKLDWSQVEDTTKYYKIGAIVVAALLALLLLITMTKSLFSSSESTDETENNPVPSVVDKSEKKKDTDVESKEGTSLENFDYDAAVRQKKEKDAPKSVAPSTKPSATSDKGSNKEQAKTNTNTKKEETATKNPPADKGKTSSTEPNAKKEEANPIDPMPYI